jgi:hypothetical protein
METLELLMRHISSQENSVRSLRKSITTSRARSLHFHITKSKSELCRRSSAPLQQSCTSLCRETFKKQFPCFPDTSTLIMGRTEITEPSPRQIKIGTLQDLPCFPPAAVHLLASWT